jgi:hypothetical protein
MKKPAKKARTRRGAGRPVKDLPAAKGAAAKGGVSSATSRVLAQGPPIRALAQGPPIRGY